MIDARRMEVYTAIFNSRGDQIESVSAKVIDKDSFSNYFKQNRILFFGNGAEKCKQQLVNSNAIFQGPLKASARFMQKLAEEKYNKNKFEDIAYFEPFYLKNFVATIPRNKLIQ